MGNRGPGGLQFGLFALAMLTFAAVARALPAEFFSTDLATPTDEAGWIALAGTHPHRVRLEGAAPAGTGATAPAVRLAVRADLEYVRVRHLAQDLAAIESSLGCRRLIIDLRFVGASLDESLRFGGLLARGPITLPAPIPGETDGLAINPVGPRAAGQQTVILVNRATRGPLEAVLAALQQRGEVLLVGTSTAGDTGHFRPVDGFPAVSIIAGEFVATSGASLLDRGATPGLAVECEPGADAAAYQALDSGTAIADLLDPPVRKARFDENTLLRRHAKDGAESGAPATDGPSASPTRNEPEPAAADRVLQRAVNALLAVDALVRHP